MNRMKQETHTFIFSSSSGNAIPFWIPRKAEEAFSSNFQSFYPAEFPLQVWPYNLVELKIRKNNHSEIIQKSVEANMEKKHVHGSFWTERKTGRAFYKILKNLGRSKTTCSNSLALEYNNKTHPPKLERKLSNQNYPSTKLDPQIHKKHMLLPKPATSLTHRMSSRIHCTLQLADRNRDEHDRKQIA